MGYAKPKTFIGVFFFIAWIFFLVSIKTLKTSAWPTPAISKETFDIILFYLNIPIFFIWLGLGFFPGILAVSVTALFIVSLFGGGMYALTILSIAITSFAGYSLNNAFGKDAKMLEVETEKLDENLNLLAEEIKSEENDNLRMRGSLERITRLKTIIEDYSLTLEVETVLDSAIRNIFNLFRKANRVLLYVVDTEKQELKLVRSKKREKALPFGIKAKKGDIFDRWVLKHRMPLLINDIHKDFRFSLLKEKIDKGFTSIINCPLMSEHKILGILRVDSMKTNAFTQSDLRFLDIISDLSCVSLQNASLYKKVQDLAIHDSLTGLYVHKYFMERFKAEIRRSLRTDTALSILMIDLDDFKACNDKYGHNVGDHVLKHISAIIKSYARASDIVCRYGGEEFAVLLLGIGKDDASRIAGEMRQKISQTPLVLRRKKMNITVSAGVASCPSEKKMAEELLGMADSRLYKAKERGKNRVCAE